MTGRSAELIWRFWVDNVALNSGAMRLPVYEGTFGKRRSLNLFDLREYDFNDTFEIFSISDYRTKEADEGCRADKLQDRLTG